MIVVTRFPPSPTGRLHIGSVRTALFNYLFTAHHGGVMYLRFEDTDKERSKKEYEKDIVDGLRWLDIPYALPDIPRQSERTEIYKGHFKNLLHQNLAYEAEASEDDPEKKVVRFRNPNKRISFDDLIRGNVSFDTTELGDFVIAKSVNEPLYHLAVVIDDYEMGVTHVIRGEDHISNTPRQILLLEALGFTRPVYAHIPLILAKDRTKLSKRHGAVSVNEYQEAGYLPEAMLNYLALLGWHPQDEKEYFTKEELVAVFDLSRVQKSGAIFDEEKLRSVNQHWMRLLSHETFIARGGLEAPDTARLLKTVPLLKERTKTFREAKEMTAGELVCLFSPPPAPRAEELLKKQPPEKPEATKRYLEAAIDILASLKTLETSEVVKNALMPYANKEGRGEVLWPLRYALSGQERSPDPFTIISIIGKEESLARIRTALAILEG